MHQFPFGRPVEVCEASRHRGGLFVLGAYPSALHVRWSAPDGTEIAALAVDNEPEPFWNGGDEDVRIADWKAQVGFDDRVGDGPARWGSTTGHRARGSTSTCSRRWASGADQAWITDCLDTYRASKAQARAIDERFRPFADTLDLDAAVAPEAPERVGDRHGDPQRAPRAVAC